MGQTSCSVNYSYPINRYTCEFITKCAHRIHTAWLEKRDHEKDDKPEFDVDITQTLLIETIKDPKHQQQQVSKGSVFNCVFISITTHMHAFFLPAQTP